MTADLSTNTGLVVLYVGQNEENISDTSHGLVDAVEETMVERTIPAARATIGQRSDIGVMVIDPFDADDEFIDAYGRFPYDIHNLHPDISILVIDETTQYRINRESFYSNRMAEIITQAGRKWAERRAERQLREHSLEILYAIARRADPRESLRKLMELWLPYLDIPLVDMSLLTQAARLRPILNLRTGDRDICAPSQDNIFQHITTLADPTSETVQILEVLCYFERMLQQQITLSLSYAINSTVSKFGAGNPLVKALQQFVKEKPAEVSAIYIRAN